MKSEALTYFMAEFSSPIDEEAPIKWAQYVYGISNVKGSGVGIFLEGTGDIIIEKALKFEFTSNNNQVEYGALIVGMILALEMRASMLHAKIDSNRSTTKSLGSTRPKSLN